MAVFIGTPDFWQQHIQAINKDGVVSILNAAQTRWFTDDFITTQEALLEQLQLMFKLIDTAGYAACCAAIRDMDSRPFNHFNALPALVIAGSGDMATTLEQSQDLHKSCQNSGLLLLKVGHLSNLECVNEFNQGLLRFFVYSIRNQLKLYFNQ